MHQQRQLKARHEETRFCSITAGIAYNLQLILSGRNMTICPMSNRLAKCQCSNSVKSHTPIHQSNKCKQMKQFFRLNLLKTPSLENNQRENLLSKRPDFEQTFARNTSRRAISQEMRMAEKWELSAHRKNGKEN